MVWAKNSALVALAILWALNPKRVRLGAINPTFLASAALLLQKKLEIVETNFDFSNDGLMTHNFFESFTPKNDVVFQNMGECVGEAKVWVMKYKGHIKIVSKELEEKIALFLNGGVQKGRLWNYDLLVPGIKDKGEPLEEDISQKIEESNEIVAFLEEKFRGNPYFDTLKLGKKTLKNQYPILLKPSLYCPKEEIFSSLRAKGVDVQVRFKPLYRLSAIGGETLPQSEELYKAILVLPLKKEIVSPLMEVLQKHKMRGCRF